MKRQSEYWAKNVLSWEKGAYYQSSEFHTKFRILDRLSKYFRGDSIYKRTDSAFETLKNHIENKTICDVGCASGRLAQRLLDNKAKFVFGIDVSEDAIELATQISIKNNNKSKTEFRVLDVTASDNPLPKCDLTISLGVIEYFDQASLQTFLSNLNSPYYFFSFLIKPQSNVFRIRNVLRHIYLYFQACPGIFYYSQQEFQSYCSNANIPGESKLVFTPGGSFITNLSLDIIKK